MVCIYFIKNNSLVRFIITIFQNNGSVEVTSQYNTIQDFFMVNLYYEYAYQNQIKVYG